MGDRVSLPSLSTVMGLFCFYLLLCLKLFTLQQRLGNSVSQLCITWAGVQLHLPALATVTALSAQTVTLRLFLLQCIIMGKFKKEM